MRLVRPSILYKDTFLKADKDVLAIDGRHLFAHPELQAHAFEDFCDTLNSYEKGNVLPEDYVHASSFWLIHKEEFIGRISLRHTLNQDLLLYSGHIGYIIAPGYRGKGYGTKILELGLIEAAKLGLKKVLLTCDRGNIASAKIIERNGGVLENEVYSEEEKVWKRRYWININE